MEHLVNYVIYYSTIQPRPQRALSTTKTTKQRNNTSILSTDTSLFGRNSFDLGIGDYLVGPRAFKIYACLHSTYVTSEPDTGGVVPLARPCARKL